VSLFDLAFVDDSCFGDPNISTFLFLLDGSTSILWKRKIRSLISLYSVVAITCS
jgi:hypothetical protein